MICSRQGVNVMYSKVGSVVRRPSTYRIRVEGHLGEGWSDRMGGMRIVTARQADGQVVTTLCGLADQAALSGVLNSLYDLGFCLLSVEQVERCRDEVPSS